MTNQSHWGEIESKFDEEVKEVDENALEASIARLTLDAPLKLHQPYSSEDGRLMEVPQECSRMEDNVVQTIKLLERIRQRYNKPDPDRSLTLKNLEADDSDRPEKKYSARFKQNLLDFDGYSMFPQTHHTTPHELRPPVAREILQKFVAALVAHAGYETAMLSSLDTLTDLAHNFLLRLTRLLRVAVDQEAQSGPHGFPDAIEWAFVEAGLGSVTSLHHYYQENVLSYRTHMENIAAKLPPPPPPSPVVAEPPQEVVRLNLKEEVQEEMEEDNVPEIHFPALVNGETSEEMQSTLETGFQMLNSLEEEALG